MYVCEAASVADVLALFSRFARERRYTVGGCLRGSIRGGDLSSGWTGPSGKGVFSMDVVGWSYFLKTPSKIENCQVF